MNEDRDLPDEDVEFDDDDTGFDINDILSNVKFDEEPAPFRPIVMPKVADENGGDSMMMVETSSVNSENIEQV